MGLMIVFMRERLANYLDPIIPVHINWCRSYLGNNFIEPTHLLKGRNTIMGEESRWSMAILWLN